MCHVCEIYVGLIIIPKPNCSGRECINSRCRRFDFLFFAALTKSVEARTAVVTVEVAAVSMCR